MQFLDHDAYLELSADADVLEADRYGEKVLRLSDGTFLKLFRRKRLFTSAVLYPYAQRFADNSELLHRCRIPCPHVLGVYRVATLARDAVHYIPLPGETLRQIYRVPDEGNHEELKAHLGTFVAKLHDQGIFFRSLHLGNIVLTPEGALGLIDIADLKRQRLPLSPHKRLRNFRHMLRYAVDRNWLLGDSAQVFLAAYLAGNKKLDNAKFIDQLKSL